MDEEYENENGYEQARPQRRRLADQGAEQSVRTLLETKGMPSSICRLVADMLENENSNGLFCSDQAISALSDVICDLQQMVDAPQSFLHDSLLMRWKPVIPNKLYCRDVELQQALAVSGQMFQCGNEGGDVEVEGPIKAHEVLMVSGHSGEQGRLSFNIIFDFVISHVLFYYLVSFILVQGVAKAVLSKSSVQY